MGAGVIDQSDLEEIRELGEEGMTSSFTITRAPNVIVDPDAPGYDPSTDYGDDVLGDFAPVNGETQPIGVTTGWLVSTQLQAQQTIGQSQLATIDYHVLRMPWGTDIQPRDVVVDNESGFEWVVIDTNDSDTWAEWLKATVRRRE